VATTTKKSAEEILEDASAWWSTSIIDIHPGKIAMRGYPIQELIGQVRFPEMVWLMLRGELPTRAQGDLLEAAMVAAVDHGPHAPSIAISRMAVSCGLPVNGAMASAINALDDIHGGAGQQCMELYHEIRAEARDDADTERARSPLSSARPADAAAARNAPRGRSRGRGSGRLCAHRPRRRSESDGCQGQGDSDEYRRRDGRHLLRAGL
jgi:citrate synthase